MRLYLKSFIDANEIDVEEEFRQACFHLSVYRKHETTEHIASTHRALTPTLADALE